MGVKNEKSRRGFEVKNFSYIYNLFIGEHYTDNKIIEGVIYG